jgi:O-acetyl-ADP-ribose deacetylase (regulator of RNase III)
MIELLRGDMFDHPADARVNTINCVAVMGKGVALAFKKRYPKMFAAYKEACRDGEIKPGGVWTYVIDNLTVFNLATKDDWRDPSRYEWIESGMKALGREIVRTEVRIVTLPAPGCGNGGLDWQRVLPIVMEHLCPLKAMVRVFEP